MKGRGNNRKQNKQQNTASIIDQYNANQTAYGRIFTARKAGVKCVCESKDEESSTLLSLWGVLEIQSIEIPISVKDAHSIEKALWKNNRVKRKVFFSWIFDLENFNR